MKPANKQPPKTPRPKKRTARVEVVKVKGFVATHRDGRVDHNTFRITFDAAFHEADYHGRRFSSGWKIVPATLTVPIPKRRSSK